VKQDISCDHNAQEADLHLQPGCQSWMSDIHGLPSMKLAALSLMINASLQMVYSNIFRSNH